MKKGWTLMYFQNTRWQTFIPFLMSYGNYFIVSFYILYYQQPFKFCHPGTTEKYLAPLERYVPPGPTVTSMREVVCRNNIRPFIPPSWDENEVSEIIMICNDVIFLTALSSNYKLVKKSLDCCSTRQAVS